jgi:protein TonB
MAAHIMSRAMGFSKNDALYVAVFVAIALHLLVILGINFIPPKPEKLNTSLHIAIVHTPAKQAPPKAQALAEDNQIGAGEVVKKPQAVPEHFASQSLPIEKPIKKIVPEKTVVPVAPKIIAAPPPPKPIIKPKAIEKPPVSAPEPPEPAVVEEQDDQPPPRLSADMLQQQIAQLGTEIQARQISADVSKIKFVESISTQKYVAAQYIRDWTTKIERVGNFNYPEVAAKKNFSGALTMDVGINADGSIYSIVISKSSGNAQLDEAAKKIVRLSAPFPPLPTALLKELNVLAITRVWRFSDEAGMTTQ